MKTVFLLLFLTATGSYAQIQGCTDPLAKNFDAKATQKNGSCEYASAKVKAVFSRKLSDSISETSGLIAFENLLWTHNDDQDTTLYGLDTKGEIQKKIKLIGVKNNDWEEISQDSAYIYIGDFGNNYKGNRNDLKIFRIEKKSFLTNLPAIDTISFSYSNQTNFAIQKANTTDFDCEAFVVLQDSIYLFTKQWSQNKTSIYVLPKTPGTHIAQLKETLNTQGLITGATELPAKKGIVLCGYSRMLQPFVYVLYDYKNNDFSTGNKRKIKIQLPFHQIEGIATEDERLFYLTNEATIKKPFVNTPQQMHSIDLSSYLKDF
jgi:hypothetical protein